MDNPISFYLMYSSLSEGEKNLVTARLKKNRKKNALLLWTLILGNDGQNWQETKAEYMKRYPAKYIVNVLVTIENVIFQVIGDYIETTPKAKLRKLITRIDICLERELYLLAIRFCKRGIKQAKRFEYFEIWQELTKKQYLASTGKEMLLEDRDKDLRQIFKLISNLNLCEDRFLALKSGGTQPGAEPIPLSIRAKIFLQRCKIHEVRKTDDSGKIIAEANGLIDIFRQDQHFLKEPEQLELFSKAIHVKGLFQLQIRDFAQVEMAIAELKSIKNSIPPTSHKLRLAGLEINYYLIRKDSIQTRRAIREANELLKDANGVRDEFRAGAELLEATALYYLGEFDNALQSTMKLQSRAIKPRNNRIILLGKLLHLLTLLQYDPLETLPQVITSTRKQFSKAGQLNEWTSFYFRALQKIHGTEAAKFDFEELLGKLETLPTIQPYNSFAIFEHFLRGKITGKPPIDFL